MKKEIRRNRDTRDFDMYLDGSYVGSRSTHQAAREELDRLAFEQLRRGN